MLAVKIILSAIKSTSSSDLVSLIAPDVAVNVISPSDVNEVKTTASPFASTIVGKSPASLAYVPALIFLTKMSPLLAVITILFVVRSVFNKTFAASIAPSDVKVKLPSITSISSSVKAFVDIWSTTTLPIVWVTIDKAFTLVSKLKTFWIFVIPVNAAFTLILNLSASIDKLDWVKDPCTSKAISPLPDALILCTVKLAVLTPTLKVFIVISFLSLVPKVCTLVAITSPKIFRVIAPSFVTTFVKVTVLLLVILIVPASLVCASKNNTDVFTLIPFSALLYKVPALIKPWVWLTVPDNAFNSTLSIADRDELAKIISPPIEPADNLISLPASFVCRFVFILPVILPSPTSETVKSPAEISIKFSAIILPFNVIFWPLFK